jgi:hypothetical protein
MTKKIGDKKVGGVDSTRQTGSVKETGTVSQVGSVKATTGVGGVGGVGAVGKRRPTRTMTLQEREELFRMIDEEAEKMLKNGLLPPEKRAAVQSAVKMAVDAGIADEDGDSEGKKKS